MILLLKGWPTGYYLEAGNSSGGCHMGLTLKLDYLAIGAVFVFLAAVIVGAI